MTMIMGNMVITDAHMRQLARATIDMQGRVTTMVIRKSRVEPLS